MDKNIFHVINKGLTNGQKMGKKDEKISPYVHIISKPVQFNFSNWVKILFSHFFI